ncbi:MAG: hypothetical protein J7J89_03670, partial [Thermoplasmata archaeon]|nr:hypothetical protein [Thermoplasmata archaeon]
MGCKIDRNIAKNKNAVSAPLEFTVVLGVLVITFSILFSSLGQVFIPYDVSNADCRARAMEISEKLIKDTGKTIGGEVSWENDVENVSDVGLAVEDTIYDAVSYGNGSLDVIIDNRPRPDLAVVSLTYTPTDDIYNGDTIDASFAVENIGEETSYGFFWNVLLDNNPISSGDYQFNVTPSEVIPFENIQVTIPDDGKTSYILTASISPYYPDVDANTSNNHKSIVINVKNRMPDLAVTTLTYEPDTNLHHGEDINIAFIVENIKNFASDGFDWEVTLDDSIIESGSHDGLNGGESVTFDNIDAIIPSDDKTKYTLKAAIYPHGEDELSSNNYKSKTIILTSETDEPIVQTIKAKNITTSTATLVGELLYMGTYDSVSVGFQYRKKGSGEDWTNISSGSKSDVGEFTADLSRLSEDTLYEFRAYAKGGDYTDYGDIHPFHTNGTDEAAEVNAIAKSAKYSITLIEGILNLRGEVDANRGSEGSYVEVWFTWRAVDSGGNELRNGVSPSKIFYFDSPTYGNGTLHVSSIYDLVEDFNIDAFTTRWVVYPDFYYKLHAKVCDENDKTLAYDESEEKFLQATRLAGIETLGPEWKPLIGKVELKARISILGVLVGGTLKVHFHVWVCLPDGSEISRDIPHPDEEISVLEALDRRYTKTISSSDLGMDDWLIGYRYYVCIEGEYNKAGEIIPVNGGVKSFVPGSDWYTKPQVDTCDATHVLLGSQNSWRLWGYLVSKGDPFKWVTFGFRYMEATAGHSVSELYKEGFNLTSYVHEVYPLNYNTYVPKIKYSKIITINPNKKYAYIAFAYYKLLDGTYIFGFGGVYYIPGGNLTDNPEVETVGAIPNSTKAVLKGRLSRVPENVSGCTVGFKFKRESAALWRSVTYGYVENGSEYEAVASPLIPGLNYEYKAIVEYNGETFEGEIKHFKAKPGSPQISAGDVTDITINSATIHGTLESTGGDNETCYVWVKYRKQNDLGDFLNPVDSPPIKMNTPGPFSITLSNLEPSSTYRYRVYANNSVAEVHDPSGITYSWIDFNTESATPVVEATGASDITNNSAVLNGKLESLGGVDNCTVWFVYKKKTGLLSWSNEIKVGTKTMNEPGSFSYQLTGLDSGTHYKYRVYADNGIEESHHPKLFWKHFNTTRDEYSATISGHVYGEDGSALSGATVTASRGTNSFSDTTDSNGYYSLSVSWK